MQSLLPGYGCEPFVRACRIARMPSVPVAKNVQAPEAIAVQESVTRMLSSAQFARAETQRRLLQYLWENRGRVLNEYAIATEALGRSNDFDPGTDASIRVHMSRLRRKLKDYYLETGEPEILLLPLGTHQLLLREPQLQRQTLPVETAAPIPPPIATAEPTAPRLRRVVGILGAICGLLVVALAIAVNVAYSRGQRMQAASLVSIHAPNAFWASFLAGDAPVKIVLPTPTFFNFPEHRTLRMRSTEVNAFDEIARDPSFKAMADKLGPIELEQSYTVTWDTLAAIQMARYLDRAGLDKRVSFEVTRDSSLLSLEQTNTILLGTNNTLHSVQKYMDTMNFRMPTGTHQVTNAHPVGSEPAIFERVVQGRDRQLDPAIVAVLPGRAAGLKILLLESEDTGGLTTLLTSSAGSDAIEEMWRADGSPAFYEMVVMTELEGHAPLRSWPVALHAYTQTPPSGGL